MLDYMTPSDIYSQLMIMRSHDEGSCICLVEGKTDYKALTEHINSPAVHLIIGYGRKNVECAMEIVATNGLVGVLAITDSDFDSFLGNRSLPPIFRSEMHDLEADIFLLPRVADRIIHNFSESDSLRSNLGEVGARNPSAVIIRMASILGLIRYASSVRDLNLTLGSIPYGEVLSKHNTALDHELLARIIYRKSQNPSVASIVVENLVAVASDFDGISLSLCRGHDLCGLTAASLRKWWGGNASAETIERALRSALTCTELDKLALSRDADSWGKREGYKIWNCDAA